MNKVDKDSAHGFLKMSDKHREAVEEMFKQGEVVEEGKFRFKEEKDDD